MANTESSRKQKPGTAGAQAQTVRTDARGEVLAITLDRPERLNAWTPRMADEIHQAIVSANADPLIGAIVMTGAGRGFCAGADMETLRRRIGEAPPGSGTESEPEGMPPGLDWVHMCQTAKPLIAAVNGACVGIGLTQILPFDVIVASDAARFCMGFVKVGLVPELASTRLLAARVGPGRARALALSADVWPADQAYRFGLADFLFAADEMPGRAVELAARIAANPGKQVQWTKHLMNVNALEPDIAAVQHRESELLRLCWASGEHAEAVTAFAEKRSPNFPPRPAASPDPMHTI